MVETAARTTAGAALDVRGLRVELASGDVIVDEVAFALRPGEIAALVGESGSGKTTVGLAVLGYARAGARLAAGTITSAAGDVLAMDAAALRALRGREIAYVPQDPAAALNPALRIGLQLTEVIEAHEPDMPNEGKRARVAAALVEVSLPSDAAFQRRYPHQLSGGQQQRVALAMAMLLRPGVLVMDEPTTGLDVTTQARILDVVRRLCGTHAIAVLYVTHDLAVVGQLAHRVMVMYAGKLVESGPVSTVFEHPSHPYTRALLTAVPEIHERRVLASIPGHPPRPGSRPVGCGFQDRCPLVQDGCRIGPIPVRVHAGQRQVRCLFPAHGDAWFRAGVAEAPRAGHQDRETVLAIRSLSAQYGDRPVLREVNLELAAGECVALVGESGSGKSTLARCIIGLHDRYRGEVLLRGNRLAHSARQRPAQLRRVLQYVFQSPHNSLNPRRTVREIVGQPYQLFFSGDRRATDRAVAAALDRVGLPAASARLIPRELSGGERQRVAIARSLICDPDVLICDEVTSALDVSIQAAVVELLGELQRQENLAMLFVTHNLALVRQMADRVLVLDGGRVIESGPVPQVIERPGQPYTRQLVSDTPSLVSRTADLIPSTPQAEE